MSRLPALAQAAVSLIVQTSATANVVPIGVVLYITIHERVVDVKPVSARILSYAALTSGVMLGLLLFNWEFAAQLAAHRIVIPIEIAGAVVLGYWLSGLRDVASFLSLANLQTQTAGPEGRAESTTRRRALSL